MFNRLYNLFIDLCVAIGVIVIVVIIGLITLKLL